jgi:glyoxylase-like metal-dependent hydrolase (beta-lactamase superfamily II)
MQHERVSENVYWFQSEIYAQVTASAVIGPQWAVLIDTLIPQETEELRDYIVNELLVPVKYIINTHHHADHSWGNCFFPRAIVIGHTLCHELMVTRSSSALAEAGETSQFYRNLDIIPPHITLSEGTLGLRVGKKQLQIFPTPGHTPDSISVLLEDERILFAGDAFMPIPYVVGGDADVLTETIRRIGSLGLENIIQGHGDIILRGEIEESVKSNLAYLHTIQRVAKTAARRKNQIRYLDQHDIEVCGKSRVALAGTAQELHRKNLIWLTQIYQSQIKAEKEQT